MAKKSQVICSAVLGLQGKGTIENKGHLIIGANTYSMQSVLLANKATGKEFALDSKQIYKRKIGDKLCVG